ncbi:hypothetical protein [Streptomyces purpureus]|uniref:hypothetical protein n=1 Tax=Streptomyces purpureus TaxID=1951 RepID=UPI0003696A3D|nr:hypothetical protein [Streptomyces purpureus]
MSCLASAAMAGPAAAVQAPVNVPLEGLESVSPALNAPTLSTGVPLPMPGAPTEFHEGMAQAVPGAALPRLPVSTELPRTVIEAPAPDTVDEVQPGRAQLTSPGSDMDLLTPGAQVVAPLTGPRAEHLGLPGYAPPKAGLAAPDVQGTLDSNLGLVP